MLAVYRRGRYKSKLVGGGRQHISVVTLRHAKNKCYPHVLYKSLGNSLVFMLNLANPCVYPHIKYGFLWFKTKLHLLFNVFYLNSCHTALTSITCIRQRWPILCVFSQLPVKWPLCVSLPWCLHSAVFLSHPAEF